MRIVLDTGVLWRPQAIRRAQESGLRLVVPAVAFAERARQVRRDGVPVARLLATFLRWGASVEALGVEEAARFCPLIHDDSDWLRLSRDALIAGHVRPGDVLWTTNPRDFLEIGVPASQVMVVS